MIYLAGIAPAVCLDIEAYLQRQLGAGGLPAITMTDQPLGLPTTADDLIICHQDLAAALPPLGARIVLGKLAPLAMAPMRQLPLPFSLAQLASAVRDWLRSQSPARNLPLGKGWSLNTTTRLIEHEAQQEAITLTDKEAELLALLLAHGQQGVDKRQILLRVWGYGDALDTHTLETHIYRLRNKLALCLNPDQGIITTADGYRFGV